MQESQHARKSLNQGEKFLWTQFSVGIWGQKANIPSAEQSLKSLFRINHFALIENYYIHFPQFLSSLPMTWTEYVQDLKNLNLLKTALSSECGNLVPMQGEWQGTRSPNMLLVGRRGQLMNWNPFDNKFGNYNVVVVGRSGSGKSVFMQDLILSGLGVGAKVFIFDVGRSFEKTCESLQGQFIQFSKDSDISLNPFSKISLENEEERTISFSFLKTIIASMAAPDGSTTPYENSSIEEAIRYVWEQKKNKATITDIAYWLIQQEDLRDKSLGKMLTPYTKHGVYAKYFERENNVDFTSPMVLVELEELKEQKDLQSVVLQLFIMTITNIAFLGNRKTPFYICIDEAWDLLRGRQTGVFIETLARRLRKYNGSLVVGTQSVEDFYTTTGALAAYDNSDWLCLLSQKKSSINRLMESKKIDLDERKKFALESISTRHGEYSEIMICGADGGSAIARLILDPFSNLLYTTKAQEYAHIQELRNKGMSISEAINLILKTK